MKEYTTNPLFTLLSLLTLFFTSFSVASMTGPPDIVGNGTFADGTTFWNVAGGTMAVPGSCAAEQLEMVTFASMVAQVTQCINIVDDPTGTWTFSVGTASSGDAFALVGAYNFSDQAGCIGPSLGQGNFTPPNSQSAIAHPVGTESVQITLRTVPDFGGGGTPVTACFDDVSFVDSGGVATMVTMQDAAASAPPTAASTSLLWVVSGLLMVLTLMSWTAYRRR